jgi:hypothetical protein
MSSPKPIELHLCALDVEMADAWSTCFGSEPSVFVHQQDILTRTADAILSPANSFGFMDGGIDLLYSNFFGWELQDRWTVCESPSERSTPARYQSGAL